MARVVITGSADGLGRLAADSLLAQGHEVVVHARNRERLAAVSDLLDRGAAAVVGDLSHLDETRHVAEQVNRLGRMDAVIHNAGVVRGPAVLPVNVVAPYLLTALIERPQRLVYLSSGMHRGGRSALAGMDWRGSRSTGSYSDSKLFVTTRPSRCYGRTARRRGGCVPGADPRGDAAAVSLPTTDESQVVWGSKPIVQKRPTRSCLRARG
jgi:NAD(P)-dependent dehydrogenase (short-subunit alcohol dehydrogenase family)